MATYAHTEKAPRIRVANRWDIFGVIARRIAGLYVGALLDGVEGLGSRRK